MSRRRAKNLAEGAAAIAKAKSVGAKTPARARLSSTRSAPCTPTTTRSITARACWPMPRRWSSWRSAIRTTTKRRSTMRSRSTPSASPADKTYANQLKGAAILEPIFKRQPQHPGVAHYLIHLYDSPAIAEKGLDAARRYAKIAPAAAHAQHMPSHIFTRVGYWKELIALQHRSRSASRRRPRISTTSCTRWTTWSMPICSSGRTRKPRPSSTR